MNKRTIRIDDYDTAADGLWTLSAWELGDPEPVTNFIDVPGRIEGPLDASTALTDGEVRYGPRPLTITLESSEGNRLQRETRISAMVNTFHGQRVRFSLPDDPLYYVIGRASVKRIYNDLVHGAVQVDATCEPWKYSIEQTVVTLEAAEDWATATLYNMGLMPAVPVLTVTDGEVNIVFKSTSWTLSAGSYTLPGLRLPPGQHSISYRGEGVLSIAYREAVLR